jgi:hypothetical protein
MAPLDLAPDLVEALGVARREQQQSVGDLAGEGERLEHPALLARHRRAGDRARAGRRRRWRSHAGELGRGSRSRRLELEVAGDGDAIARDAERQQAVAIERGLHAEVGDRVEQQRPHGAAHQAQPPEAERSEIRPLTTTTGTPRRRASRSTSGQ